MTNPDARQWYGAYFSGESVLTAGTSRSWTGKVSCSKIPAPAGEKELKNIPVAGCSGIQESMAIWLDTPFTSKGKALKILPSLLDVQLPFPLEDCYYDFVSIRRKPDSTLSVLAVAARRASIRQRIARYEAAGIDPLVIDHEGLAVWEESLREKKAETGTVRVIFLLEPGHIGIVIGEGKTFLNSHSLQISSNPREERQNILSGVQRILQAELQGKKEVAWVFCGSLALQTDLVNTIFNFCKNIWTGSLFVHKEPELLLPRALASRAIRRQSCNLRRDDLLHPALKAQMKRRSLAALTVFALTGLLLIGFNLAWQVIGHAQFEKARQIITSLGKEIAPQAVIAYGREETQLRQIMQKRINDFAPALDMFAQPLSIRLAEIINFGKKHELNYTRLELSRSKAVISGTIDDWNYCDYLVNYLKSAGYETEIDRREAEDDNLVHFVVKGSAQP
jgi:hypothetical protein